MKRLVVIFVTICFLFSITGEVLANPWGIAMKILGGAQLLIGGNEDKKEVGEKSNFMERVKENIVKKSAQKGYALKFADAVEAVSINSGAFTVLCNATMDSKPIKVAIIFIKTRRGNEDGWQTYDYKWTDEKYQNELQQHNNSLKHLIYAKCLEYNLNPGPLEGDQSEQTAAAAPKSQPAITTSP